MRGDVRALEGKAFSCGHTELEMSVRHPNGNTTGVYDLETVQNMPLQNRYINYFELKTIKK